MTPGDGPAQPREGQSRLRTLSLAPSPRKESGILVCAEPWAAFQPEMTVLSPDFSATSAPLFPSGLSRPSLGSGSSSWSPCCRRCRLAVRGPLPCPGGLTQNRDPPSPLPPQLPTPRHCGLLLQGDSSDSSGSAWGFCLTFSRNPVFSTSVNIALTQAVQITGAGGIGTLPPRTRPIQASAIRPTLPAKLSGNRPFASGSSAAQPTQRSC